MQTDEPEIKEEEVPSISSGDDKTDEAQLDSELAPVEANSVVSYPTID